MGFVAKSLLYFFLCIIHQAWTGTHIISRSRNKQDKIMLGAPFMELLVSSSLECAKHCHLETGCTASMLTGTMCWMYNEYTCNTQCPFHLVQPHTTMAIWYGLGEFRFRYSIRDVYTTCESCGTQPLAILSEKEQKAVGEFISDYGAYCDDIFTGGFMPNNDEDWFWYRHPNTSILIDYMNFCATEPNNLTGDQTVISLLKLYSYQWGDMSPDPSIHGNWYKARSMCYVCEFRMKEPGYHGKWNN